MRTPEQREKHRLQQQGYRADNLPMLRAKARAYSKTAKARELRKAYNRKHPVRALLMEARKRARKRGLDYNLVESDFTIPAVCPVLGIPIVSGGPQAGWPSLDRFDNTLGYVKGNVFVISHRANCIKRDATAMELESVVAYINGWSWG